MNFKQFLIESAKITYHGTTSKRAEYILKHGFDLKHIGEKSNTKLSGVSVTINKDIATEHAEWAADNLGGEPEILKIDISHLKIMKGSEVEKIWKELGSLDNALKVARRTFDGAELFDLDAEVGLEEFEILIFDPKKVKIIN